MATGPGGVDTATLQINVVMQGAPQAQQGLAQIATQGTRVEQAAGKTTVSMGRLNNAILGLARQASGAHPVVARFTDVLLGMAYGGPQMTAILAGLAAVAGGYALITREAREAKRATEETMAALIAAAQKRIPLIGAAERLGTADAEVSRIQRELDTYRARLGVAPGRGGGVEALLVQQLSEARGAQIEARRQMQEIQRGRADDIADRYLDGYDFVGPTYDAEARRKATRDMVAGWIETQRNNSAFRMEDRLRPWQNQLAYQGMNLDDVVDVRGAQESIARRVKQLADAEEELAQRRERANASLVLGLANVGRAYGGVTDQVLNLAAATLSLERMPMVTGRDRAMAYGSSALAGIGYGASTGSAELGLLGGAASGAAMAGPYGAIIGGISGIVSGLFEQGRRAREAQRMWQLALDDFATMFEDITPAMQVDRTFKQLSGGFSADEIEARVASLEALEDAFRASGTWGAVQRQIANWNALLDTYSDRQEKATEVTEKAAKAERDLYDARFRALNAPVGYNLAYAGYLAGAAFVPPTGQPPIVVKVAIDGKEVATAVNSQNATDAKLGGARTVTTR